VLRSIYTTTIAAAALAATISSCGRSCSSKEVPATEPAASARGCDEILAELETTATSGSNACESDHDCTCYNLPYKTGTCGLAISKKTNGDLVALTVEAKAAGCDLPVSCPGWKCTPHCNRRPGSEGFCTHLSPCAELSKRFDEVLSGATGKCEKDEDCGVYRAGVGRNCGGVTDAETAGALSGIFGEFFAASCDYVVQCAPRAPFVPRCANGVCTDG